MALKLYAIVYTIAISFVIYIGLAKGWLLGALSLIILMIAIILVFTFEAITSEWRP